jgi:hypothetical protein
MKTENKSFTRDERHIIFHEHVLAYTEQMVDPHTDAVVVLSGPPKLKGGPDNYRELNAAKVRLGVEAIRTIGATLLKKSKNEITPEEFVALSVPLIVDGEDEVVDEMRHAAVEVGFPSTMVKRLPCGPIGQADTRHNFWEINKHFPELKRMTVVTGAEHVPRALRTGLHELANPEAKLHMLGYSPEETKPTVELGKTVVKEIRKIGAYSAPPKEDLAGILTEKELTRVVSEDLVPLQLD